MRSFKRFSSHTLGKSLVFTALSLGFAGFARAQGISVDMTTAANGTTVNTCSGALHDSGGTPGTGYSNNENVIITICPDTPGDAVSIDFLTFNLNTTGPNADNFTIYDGNSTGATSLGTYTGTGLSGYLVTCSSLNTSGCLTLEFHSNNAGTGVFAGSISCTTPCQRPVAVLSAPTDTLLKICQGETVAFNGTPSYAAPGFNIDQYYWDFGDGTIDTLTGPVVNHTFNNEGEYRVDLYLFDDNDCASTNRVTVQVWVGTEPILDSTSNDTTICLGESVCLNGVVIPVTYTGLPYNNLGGATYLPDAVGSCFQSTINFGIFAPGATLTNINQLLGINVTMEHSFMGDLVASIICPDGTSVIMHQQLGGGTHLGEPVDISGPSDPPGIGYTYTWSPTATNGTWADNATTSTVSTPAGTALAPGTYESVFPLSGLLGCPLNGVWTLEFCDLWGADDGWVFDWSIDFDPALYPDITEFTPVYGEACDSTYWTPDNPASAAQITSTDANCDQICITPNATGSYSYTYTAIDDFGCEYSITRTVTVTPGPTPDAGADITVCPNIPGQLDGDAPGAALPCTYTIHMHDSYGDGWNGANIEVTIDGVPATYGMSTGSNINHTFTIPAGSTYSFEYNSGSWESEVTFEIVDCNGVTVYSDGPNPTTGVILSGVNGADIVYSWSPATGLSDPNIANPFVTVSAQTTYYLTVYENGHPLCANTDSVVVFINPLVDAGISDSITICFSEPAFDMFALIGGTPATTGAWFDAAGNPVTNMYDPATMASGDYLYITAPAGGCPPDTAIISVTELGPGDPMCCMVDYTVTTTDITCNAACDGTITVSSSNVGTSTEAVLFSFDGGTTFGPDSVATGLCPGTYNIVLQDSAGCITTTSATLSEPLALTVNVNLITNVSCFGFTDGEAEAIAGGGTGTYDYLWDNSCAQTTPILGANCVPAGTYNVTVTDDNGCTATDNIAITEPPVLTLALNTTDVSCFGQCDGTAQVEVTGGTLPYNYNWAGLAASTAVDASNICAGTYNLIVTDGNNCSIDTLGWSITQPLQVSITVVDVQNEICYNNCDGSIVITAQNAPQYSIDGGTTFSSSGSFQNLCVGTYNIMVTDANGNCPASAIADIIGPDPVEPNFSFMPIPATILNPQITFSNTSVNATSYVWDFAGLGASSETNPTFEFPQDSSGVYNVCLTAINDNGCDSTICYDIIIEDIFVLYAPNAFTPNGDGINDIFYVQGRDLDPDNFEMTIFNRWGEAIFKTTDFGKGWDGNENNIKCKTDTYVWKIKAKSLQFGTVLDKTGHVTLLR